jgi:hypothetical protein
MNRRNYLTTIGASLASPSALSSLTDSGGADDNDDDGSNMPPTYYVVSMPSISVELIHISIPDYLLDRARSLRVYSDEGEFYLRSVEFDGPDNEGNSTIRNYIVPNHPVDTVSVGGVSGRKWDVLEVQRAAMFFQGGDDEGYVGIVCDDRPVSIETPDAEVVCQVKKYTQRPVPTDDASEVTVWTRRGGEQVKIPLYSVNDWEFYHRHKTQ